MSTTVRRSRRSIRLALGMALLLVTLGGAPAHAGYGTVPLTLSPTSWDFGAVIIGADSATKVFTLTNEGAAAELIDFISTVAPFAVTANDCGFIIAADSSCAITVRMQATPAGPQAGTLTVDGDFIVQATVTGIGVDAKPDFRIRKPGGVLKGNNIYNTDAVGQFVHAGNAPGTTRQFILSIQNDSEAPDAFRIIGVSTILTNSFTVTYRRLWQPAVDITSQVNSLALTTHTLAPGEIFYFRVYIDVPVSNSAGDLYGAVLQIASLADGTKTDAVRFRVTVI